MTSFFYEVNAISMVIGCRYSQNQNKKKRQHFVFNKSENEIQITKNINQGWKFISVSKHNFNMYTLLNQKGRNFDKRYLLGETAWVKCLGVVGETSPSLGEVSQVKLGEVSIGWKVLTTEIYCMINSVPDLVVCSTTSFILNRITRQPYLCITHFNCEDGKNARKKNVQSKN